MRREVELTVNNHIAQLRDMAANGEISNADHNTVGAIMMGHVGQMIELSDTSWEMFKRIVDESRKVHYRRL